MDPSQAYVKCKVPMESFKAAVAVPAALRTNSLHPQITNLNELLVIRTTFEQIQAATGLHPSIGVLGSPSGQVWVDLTKRTLERDIHEYYLKCIFDIVVERLKDTFVGEVADMQIQHELQHCMQQRYNTQLRRMEELSVVQYYEEFSNIVTGSPYDVRQPFLFEIGYIY
jgi:hypothetical protein